MAECQSLLPGHARPSPITETFALNVLCLAAADVAIAPLFATNFDDHLALVDAQNFAVRLVVEENHPIDDLVPITPIPAVACVEGYACRPPTPLEANQVITDQSLCHRAIDVLFAE